MINLHNIDFDKEDFHIKEGVLSGENIVLITPKFSTKWNKNNIVLRSSVWHKEGGRLISGGFKKFGTIAENPEVFIVPREINVGDRIENKIDGSLLAITYFNGKLNTRTRGVIDATQHDNGYEIEILKQKYPLVFNNNYIKDNKHTILCEWLSDNNRIILKYSNCPDIILLNVVNNEDYTYFTNNQLDQVSEELKIRRPEQFTFKNLDEILEKVKEWKDKEGVVWYSQNGQHLLRLKSA
ncbi:MAG: hypothetical protein AABY22_05340, partial [Nanoarchaeota archaeon]